MVYWASGQESTFLLLFKLEAEAVPEESIKIYCRRASLLCKISTIHDKSFKAMAETYHIYKLMKLKWLFITTCADYILSFHTLVRTIVITQWLYLLSTAGESECVSVQILPLREGPLWGPVGSLRVLPPIWYGQIPLLYPGNDISKNNLSRPCSFRGDRCKSFPVFFCLVFY